MCYHFAGRFCYGRYGIVSGSYDTDGTRRDASFTDIVIGLWYIHTCCHFAGKNCYRRYVRRHFYGSHDMDGMIGRNTILKDVLHAIGSGIFTKRETYHSILLQRLTHHDGA